MRAAVIVLNVLSVLVTLVVEPAAFYVGAWGLLGPAYGDQGSAALGIAIMAAPVAVTALSLWVSIRRMREGRADSVAVAAAPLVLALVAALAFASVFSGH